MRARVAGQAVARHRLRHDATVRPVAKRESQGGVGWSGSIFWPKAHDDILGFAFRPATYGESFWATAYDEVFDNIFWPPSHTDDGTSGHAAARAGPTGRNETKPPRLAALSRELVQACDERATGAAEWPFARLDKTMRLADAQGAALDELRAASAQAIKVLNAACPPDVPRTPVARLDVMEHRLAATLRAIDILSPAVETFYNTLGDEQKARFNPPGTPSTSTGPGDVSTGSIGQRLVGRGDSARICDEQVPKFAELTVRHIEQVVRPTDAQRAALDDLKASSSRATETLRAACPTDRAATPKARLDRMRQRVAAMLEAVQTVRPALKNFYAMLTDEQKERFNAMSARKTD